MEADYQYVLAKDKNRFLVLKTIYRDSNGDKDKVSSSHDICEKTGICSEELLQILVYLENEGLIKPMGSLYGGIAFISITHQGIREVEAAIKKPQESTAHFPAQVFQNTYNAPVGVVQQGGQSNTANVKQNIGLHDCDELIVKLLDLIKSSSLSDLDKEDTIEAANRISELAKKEESPGVIQRIKERLEFINNTFKPAKELYDKTQPILLALSTYFKIHYGA